MYNNLLQVVHQAIINEMGKIRPIASKNQDRPLLNYLLKNTPSKLKTISCCLQKHLSKKLNLGK
jgi:hypothetical protein